MTLAYTSAALAYVATDNTVTAADPISATDPVVVTATVQLGSATDQAVALGGGFAVAVSGGPIDPHIPVTVISMTGLGGTSWVVTLAVGPSATYAGQPIELTVSAIFALLEKS